MKRANKCDDGVLCRHVSENSMFAVRRSSNTSRRMFTRNKMKFGGSECEIRFGLVLLLVGLQLIDEISCDGEEENQEGISCSTRFGR